MLKGTLDDFTLADIFRLMSLARRTGKLEVVRSAGRGKVFVREGEVYYAESSLVREPLGQKLIRLGALTEGALMKALDENAATGKRVGEILVENGSISYEQLQKALQQQIEDAVFDLLRWDLGDFTWEPGVVAEVEVNIAVSVENLIIEASRRLDELEVISRKIPSVDSLLKMANTPPEGAAEINITPEEWRMLVLVDGTRSVHDIGVQVGVDDLTALRSLYGLVSAGLVEVEEGRDSIEAAGKPGEQVRDFSKREEDEGSPEVATDPSEEASVEEMPALETASEGFGSDMDAQITGFDDPVGAGEEPVDEVTDPEGAESPAHPEAVEVETTPESEMVADAAPEEPPSVTDFSDFDSLLGTSPDAAASTAVTDPVAEEDAVAEAEPESEVEVVADASDEGTADDVFTDEVPAVDEFDSPAEDEMVSMTPSEPTDGDPFLTDLLSGDPDASTDADAEVEAEATSEQMEESVASSDETHEAAPDESGDAPAVDRASVVRELAGLFDDDRPRVKRAQGEPSASSEEPAPPAQPRRIEDDDQLNKGLIGRLIDGVKGL